MNVVGDHGDLDKLVEWAVQQEGLVKRGILDVSTEDLPEYLALKIQKKKKRVLLSLIAGILSSCATFISILTIIRHPVDTYSLWRGIGLTCFAVAALIYLIDGIKGRLYFNKYVEKELLLLKYSRECQELRQEVERLKTEN